MIGPITTAGGPMPAGQPSNGYREEQGEIDRAVLDAVTEAEIEGEATEDMPELAIEPDWTNQAAVIYQRGYCQTQP